MRGSDKQKSRGYLRAAFAAVAVSAAAAGALFGGCGVVNNTPDQIDTPENPGPQDPGPAQPDIINAFGQSAQKLPVTRDPYRWQWEGMINHQKESLNDPAKVEAYKEFLAQFDRFRGEPLAQAAENVNHLVNTLTVYWTDQDQYNQADYWAAPVETVLNHKGDCEDFAILEEAVLRYLGVPESRMFIATVNSRGFAAEGVDHAILLLDESPDGTPQEFFVLGDAQPVLPDDNNVIGNTWLFGSRGAAWRGNFILMDARNEAFYWQAPEDPVSWTAGPISQKPVPRGPRIG